MDVARNSAKDHRAYFIGLFAFGKERLHLVRNAGKNVAGHHQFRQEVFADLEAITNDLHRIPANIQDSFGLHIALQHFVRNS